MTDNINTGRLVSFEGLSLYILSYVTAAGAAKPLQSCPTLCDPIDGSPPGFPVPGILQARTLEWVAISFSSAWKWSCSVVSDSRDPTDCSLPGSSVHGIFQAKVLEWGAIAFSICNSTETNLRPWRQFSEDRTQRKSPGNNLCLPVNIYTEGKGLRSFN